MSQFSLDALINPEFELVALHPEHFLPNGAVLTVYGPEPGTRKDYVPAADRRLRESHDPASPALPPFRHNSAYRRRRGHRINPLLVILNAEIRFRRYLRMVEDDPPEVPLPDDVLNLMRRTMEFVDLLYWNVGIKNKEKLQASRYDLDHCHSDIHTETELERARSASDGEGDDEEPRGSYTFRSGWRRDFDWDNADLETRRAYGTSLMFGIGIEYPELFNESMC
jgi:hypothetical protein